MKVKKLIQLLRKMPQDAEVFCISHDQSEWEHDTVISSVTLRDQSKMSDYAKECLERDDHFKINKPYVTIG